MARRVQMDAVADRHTEPAGPVGGKQVRKSIRATEVPMRKSQYRPNVDMSAVREESLGYADMVEEAKLCIGSGGMEGAFYEEWDAQLLIKCNDTSKDEKLVIFCPGFLSNCLDDEGALDRALKYILLTMDPYQKSPQKFVFVMCVLGLDSTSPALAERLRLVFDILPNSYNENLNRFYILMPDMGLKMTVFSFWPWFSREFWNKIEYVDSMDALLFKIHPSDEALRNTLRRRFPLIVHRKDFSNRQLEAPEVFGMPIKEISTRFGVDFVDKTTNKYYEKLPCMLIFICEPMEREGVDKDFHSIYDLPDKHITNLMSSLSQGRALHRDTPGGAYWCVLKLFLECLPEPLLGGDTLQRMLDQDIKAGDMNKQRKFLITLMKETISQEAAYSVLYLASFLSTMCDNASIREADVKAESDQDARGAEVLTSKTAARVFAPCLMWPKNMTQDLAKVKPMAESLVETLIECAEEPDLWIGREIGSRPSMLRGDSSSDDDD